ncbi:MAG: hypothetical protein AB9Q19_05840 [Candidatus Reddybacter sp.]
MFASEELDSHADSGSFGCGPVVIRGWLFRITCTYFADARDCQKIATTVARLKVSIEGFSAMREDNIEAFLAASSAEIVAITLRVGPSKGGGRKRPQGVIALAKQRVSPVALAGCFVRSHSRSTV